MAIVDEDRSPVLNRLHHACFRVLGTDDHYEHVSLFLLAFLIHKSSLVKVM